MTKDEIRDEIKAKRRALSADDIRIMSDKISSRLFALDCFKKASVVMTYLSAFKEPSTDSILDKLFSDNKKNCRSDKQHRGFYDYAVLSHIARRAYTRRIRDKGA
jgi:5-formyltetrahydrofolate cyclo-ligase